jgi:hypothetical protein
VQGTGRAGNALHPVLLRDAVKLVGGRRPVGKAGTDSPAAGAIIPASLQSGYGGLSGTKLALDLQLSDLAVQIVDHLLRIRDRRRLAGSEFAAASPLEGTCVDALRGSRAFLASETVMPVAGLCPACSCGPMAAGRDGLSASRGSHLDFALDAHALASGLPRSSVRLTVRHLLRPAFRSVTCR